MLSNYQSSDGAHLLSLVNLIQTSVSDLLAEYKAADAPVPSLDSVEPVLGPFDAVESTSPRLRRTIRIIQAACDQLCASVSSPPLLLLSKGLAYEESSCIQVAIGAKVADHLAASPGGMHISELADKTGVNEDKRGRILRLLSTKHVFREKEPGVFTNNRLSVRLRSDDPTYAILDLFVGDCFKVAPDLFDALSDPTLPDNASVFERVFKCNLFEYHESVKGRKKVPNFAKAMIGFGDISGKTMLVNAYPWTTISPTKPTTICDVGGGSGHVTMALMTALPTHSFKVIVQDQANMLEEGRKLWASKNPEASNAGKVDFVPIDFLNEPPVAGCDFYYLRYCLHNWPDNKAAMILTNIAQAMRKSPKTSKFLLHDFVLHSAMSSAETKHAYAGAEAAPAPLLSNYGAGASLGYNMDLIMLTYLGAKERTLEEVISLASKNGFVFQQVWDAGETSILEFTVA